MEINVERLFSDKNVTFITKHYQQNSFTSPRHYHNEYEMAFIEESEGKLFVGNNIVEFKAGDLFVFAPKLVHCFKNKTGIDQKDKSAKATIVLFKRDFFGNEFIDRKETSQLKKFLLNAEEGIYITNLSKEIISLMKNLSNKNGLESILDFIALLDSLSKVDDYKLLSIQWFKNYYYKLKDDRLYTILDYAEKNFAKGTVFKDVIHISKLT